jgi:group I intron endonuclease
MYYTYAHYTADTKELFYIGKGQRRRAWQSCSRNRHWNYKVAKHGFIVEVLAYWETDTEALLHEKLLISIFKPKGRLVNIADEGCSSGVKWTPEQKEAIRQRLLGVPRSEECKANMSKALKGRKQPSERAKKSAEQLAIIRETQKKKILCVTTNTLYASASDASKAENVDTSSIIKACKGILKKPGKKEWRYG